MQLSMSAVAAVDGSLALPWQEPAVGGTRRQPRVCCSPLWWSRSCWGCLLRSPPSWLVSFDVDVVVVDDDVENRKCFAFVGLLWTAVAVVAAAVVAAAVVVSSA